MNYIDYSQYATFMSCPHKWFMRYRMNLEKNYSRSQRDDALAIGSLVHAGIENFNRHQLPIIPSAIIEEIGPTPEALQQCEAMVQGYPLAYPNDPWTLINTEEPLRWPLTSGLEGLAKVDSYFRVDTQIEMPSGLQDQPLILEPGFWIQEYKTKHPSVPPAKFIQSWETKMQADFQLLAASYNYEQSFQGILVNVIEKPSDYIPKRTCKSCKFTQPFSSYTQREGLWICPTCGASNKFDPPSGKPKPANYFRFAVRRSPLQLAFANSQIQRLAIAMDLYTDQDSYLLNRESCLTTYGECPYYKICTYGEAPENILELKEAKDYVYD